MLGGSELTIEVVALASIVALSVGVLVWAILGHFERRVNERIASLEATLDRFVGGADDIAGLEERTGDRIASLEGGFGARIASLERKIEGRLDRLARLEEVVRLENRVDGLASNIVQRIDRVLVAVSRGRKDGDEPDGGVAPRQ